MNKIYNIIYVEDNKDILRLVKIILSSERVILNTFDNLEDALHHLSKYYKEIDLLITDGNYPLSSDPKRGYEHIFNYFNNLEKILYNERQKNQRTLMPGEVLSLFSFNKSSKIKRIIASSSKRYSLDFFDKELKKPFRTNYIIKSVNELLGEEVYSY